MTKITLSVSMLRDEVLHDLATTHPEAAVRLPCWQELDRRFPEDAKRRLARVREVCDR